jgi:hypothetical protein
MSHLDEAPADKRPWPSKRCPSAAPSSVRTTGGGGGGGGGGVMVARMVHCALGSVHGASTATCVAPPGVTARHCVGVALAAMVLTVFPDATALSRITHSVSVSFWGHGDTVHNCRGEDEPDGHPAAERQAPASPPAAAMIVPVVAPPLDPSGNANSSFAASLACGSTQL